MLNFFNTRKPPLKPFYRWSEKEIAPADNAFIWRILKLDPRARPTVHEILQDEWFTEDSEDTRALIPGDAA